MAIEWADPLLMWLVAEYRPPWVVPHPVPSARSAIHSSWQWPLTCGDGCARRPVRAVTAACPDRGMSSQAVASPSELETASDGPGRDVAVRGRDPVLGVPDAVDAQRVGGAGDAGGRAGDDDHGVALDDPTGCHQHLVDLHGHLVGVSGVADEEGLDAPGQRELAAGPLVGRER